MTIFHEFIEIDDLHNQAIHDMELFGGIYLKEWRIAHNMSQSELAERLGVFWTMISRIERGEKRMYRPLMEKFIVLMEECDGPVQVGNR